MKVIAIGEYFLEEWQIPPAQITNQSERYQRTIQRREGTRKSMYISTFHEPATWKVVVKCPSYDAVHGLLQILDGTDNQKVRILAETGAQGQDIIYADAVISEIDRDGSDYNAIITLMTDDSIWRSLEDTVTEKTFSSPLDLSMAVDVPGDVQAYPRIRLTPKVQTASPSATVGWSKRQRYSITNTSDEPLFRYPYRIPLGNTATLVSNGKALASGSDLRVWLDGLEQPRHMLGWNSSATYIWVIIPALAPGAKIVYDIVYGNPAASSPPILQYPDIPPFNLVTSTNAKWIYDTAITIPNAGKGLWYLSSGNEGAVADYSVPGSWRPVLTFDNPNNQDQVAQPRADKHGSPAWYQSVFHGVRATRNANYILDITTGAIDETNDLLAALAGFSPFDGVAIYNPLGITSVRAGFLYSNYAYKYNPPNTIPDASGNPIPVESYSPLISNLPTAFVVLSRQTASEGWRRLFIQNSTSYAYSSIALATYTPSSPAKHMAFAVWPHNMATIPPEITATIGVYMNQQTEVNIQDSKLLLFQDQSEQDIYEFAVTLRVGDPGVVGPYKELKIGNADQASGAGVPRCATLLSNRSLIINCENHDVFESVGESFTGSTEDRSAHVARGYESPAYSLTAYPSSDWLPLSPQMRVIPNGEFDSGIEGWSPVGDDAASATIVRSHDPSFGSGSLKVAVSGSSAPIGDIANTGSRQYRMNRQRSVVIAADVRTSNANLQPAVGIGVRMDPNAEDPTYIGADTTWTPVANTTYRRIVSVFSSAEAGMQAFQPALTVKSLASNANGNVWFDNVSVDGPELQFSDKVKGQVEVGVLVQGRWR